MSQALSIHIRISRSIPLILCVEVISVEWLSAGPSEFTLEFVGSSTMWKVHLTATDRIRGGNGIVIIPVSFNVSSSKVISTNIEELLAEGQGIILLILFSMAFDVDKGQMITQGTGLDGVPDFCNDIPI